MKPRFAPGYRLTIEVVELILEEMEKQGISKYHLSVLAKIPESMLDDILDSGNNPGIFTLGQVFEALGKKVKITLEDA